MKLGSVPSAPRRAALLAMALVLAGCGTATSTTLIVYVTPAPTPIIIYVTPEPTAEPSLELTPEPSLELTPEPSLELTPEPTSAATACTGTTAGLQALLAEAASKEPFDVYCAVLPSDWWLDSGQYTQPNGGEVELWYKNSSGGVIQIEEGAWCSERPAPGLPCVQYPAIGTVSFGGLSVDLALVSSLGPMYAIFVAPGTTHAHEMLGKGMSPAQFMAWAAALVKLPKS